MASLDFPNAPTVGQIATLTNGMPYQWDGTAWVVGSSTGQVAGGDLTGTYPNPTITPAAKSKWLVSGATLTPTTTNSGLLLRYPTGTINQHWLASGNYGTRFGLNDRVTPDVTGYSSWSLEMDLAADNAMFVRRAGGAAAGAGTALLTLDATGNLTITGATATKAAPGTAWVNPSDPRLKYDVAPYDVGLDAIMQLSPISFKYNGLGGMVDDRRVCHGFDTTAVRAVMPECVGTQRVKLHPDDEVESDIATMDVSDITLALVNAVKELATKVAALEAR
jgi:hypothetical protein